MNWLKSNSQLPKRYLLFTAGALFVISFLTAFYFRINPSIGFEERQLERYIHNYQSDFNTLLKDTGLINRLANQNETGEEHTRIGKKAYSIFLYKPVADSEVLLYWNSQNILPTTAELALPDGVHFKQLINGYYVIQKQTIATSNKDNEPLAIYAFIPVLYKFDYQHSAYLRTHFVYDKKAIDKITLANGRTNFEVSDISKKPLFYIERKAYMPILKFDLVTAFLRIMAFVLLLAYIHFFAQSITRMHGAIRGIGFLAVALIGIRIFLFLLPNIFSFRQFELFDPVIYGTIDNWFNRSLGDLLINAVFVCWLVVFAWYNIGPLKRLPRFLTGKRVIAAGAVALIILILATFQYANVVRSLIADSKISFNVIDFFSLSQYTVIGFVVLALLSLSYYYFTRLLFLFIFPAFKDNPVFLYFALAGAGLLFLSFRSGTSIVLFHLPVLLWLLIYTLLVSQEQFIINRFKVTIAGVLFWIFIFSISLAAIILQENKEKEISYRKSIAEKRDEETDPSSERTLSIALTFLDNDFLRSNFHRFRNVVQNKIIRDSIISENITGYLRKYDTKIFVFDAAGRPVNNAESLTYAELNNLLTQQSVPTRTPDLYYHETAFDQYNYITKRAIRDSVDIGTFFIISTPKKYNQDALYPELFRRNEADAEHSIYVHAVYNKNLLISASNKYPFRINLMQDELPVNEYERRINGDYDELWYKASNSKIIVIAKKRNTLLESITLFSYLFCAFLFLVALLQIVSLLLRSGDNWTALNIFSQLNIRSQVHSTIIFISILSFLIIGAATISFFIRRYNQNNVDKLSRTAGIMVKEMQNQVEEAQVFDDVVKIYDSVTRHDLQDLMDEVADIHNVDVNVYDLDGNLQVTSEDEVYKRGILSTKMHPEAYHHLKHLRQVQWVQEESMVSLKYMSIYAAVRDEEGKVYAYLNIPYFLSEIDINQEISNFLVTIINLNAFIFLIAGVIALFITNRITRSFSIIGDKMKEIRLGKTNEEILWTRNDEIGELVKQYNKMVHQLEQSADALAKSEREGAWREMARQVAHEIKNPLTPMKLSIQYLQKAINNNLPNVKELTSNVANTLVEQIDHLSKIAADFARFANIGNRQVERFDLHLVLESLKELYSANPRVLFYWEQVPVAIHLRADKTHMNRLFTNLITNAIEACTDGQKCTITITEELKENNVLIKIKDNGIGIPEEMQEKIFTPNFTTKSSGTGLGLAMSKSIVEQAGGDIWFQTESGKGTTFFVQLPLTD